VVGVIEPDSDEIADVGDARPDAGRAANRWQAFRLDLGEPRQDTRRKRRAGSSR